jgi:tRNA nucleotidyltransferase (CCA-adding enzyme)
MAALPRDAVPGEPTLSERAGWEHFPHGADIGVRGWGGTIATAFEQAALATTAIVAELSMIRPKTCVDISCEAASLDDLLVEWLNAVIFEMSTRQLVFGSFRVQIADHRLTAAACGERLDPDRHDAGVEPKGATYTMLRVAHHDDGTWEAQCVVDV